MKKLLWTLLFVVVGASAYSQVIPQPGPPQPIGCAYNTTPVTLTDGQAGWIQCGPNGGILTSSSAAGQLLGITPTDRTITSATGSSQTVMGSNVARHSFTIVNTGSSNCGVNPTGGTAAIGGAGTLTLAPLGSYSPRIPTMSAITVICTAGQPVYADEN